MYELLIIACLAGQPAECDEFQIPFERATAVTVCLRQAQLRLAQWTETMPGWDIKKWTCGLPKT
jgi:hypothetical protein